MLLARLLVPGGLENPSGGLLMLIAAEGSATVVTVAVAAATTGLPLAGLLLLLLLMVAFLLVPFCLGLADLLLPVLLQTSRSFLQATGLKGCRLLQVELQLLLIQRTAAAGCCLECQGPGLHTRCA